MSHESKRIVMNFLWISDSSISVSGGRSLLTVLCCVGTGASLHTGWGGRPATTMDCEGCCILAVCVCVCVCVFLCTYLYFFLSICFVSAFCQDSFIPSISAHNGELLRLAGKSTERAENCLEARVHLICCPLFAYICRCVCVCVCVCVWCVCLYTL